MSGDFSTGNVSEQPLAWEANAVPLIAAGYGLTGPWMRLFLLTAVPQTYLGSHPWNSATQHALIMHVGFPNLISISLVVGPFPRDVTLQWVQLLVQGAEELSSPVWAATFWREAGRGGDCDSPGQGWLSCGSPRKGSPVTAQGSSSLAFLLVLFSPSP